MSKKERHDSALVNDGFFTIGDLEQRLNCSRQWIVKNLIKPGLFPYRRVGSIYFIRRDRFMEWLDGDDRATGELCQAGKGAENV